jgi:hypothetical protein
MDFTILWPWHILKYCFESVKGGLRRQIEGKNNNLCNIRNAFAQVGVSIGEDLTCVWVLKLSTYIGRGSSC